MAQATDFVLSVRADHEDQFAPRAAQALIDWPVRASEENIGGVPCQTIQPTDTDAVGTLLYFFGGGYVSGCPDYDLPITAPLSVLARQRIIAPRYVLAPEHPFPAAFSQCLGIYEALAGESNLTLSGESAGGGMALAVTQAAFDRGWRIPDTLALFSPWCDLTEEGTAQCAGIDDPTMVMDDLRGFASTYLNSTEATSAMASPGLLEIPTDWPPTLLTTGSRDLLQPMVRALHQRIQLAGARSDLIDRPDMWHVFELYHEQPSALETLRAVANFITRNTAP